MCRAVSLFKLTSGQQRSLRGRPGRVPPPHGTSWTVRVQLGHVLFPTWCGRWQLCLVHLTSFKLLRVHSVGNLHAHGSKLAEPGSSLVQHISLSLSLKSLRETVCCIDGCWKPFSVDAAFHSPVVQVARETRKEAAEVQLESCLC